jgi:hypothetical protein
VSFAFAAAYTNIQVAVSTLATSYITYFDSVRCPYPTSENTSFRVIVQKLPQPLCGDVWPDGEAMAFDPEFVRWWESYNAEVARARK